MHFWVQSGKFLGYLVSKRGIEANPSQIKAVLDIPSPKCVKDVQRLTGKIAALTRFISKSSERCQPFFDILKKNKECTKKVSSARRMGARALYQITKQIPAAGENWKHVVLEGGDISTNKQRPRPVGP